MSELSKRSDLGESSSILLHFLASKSNAFLSLEISFRFAANSGRLVNSDIQQYFLQNRQSIGHFCGVAVRHFNNHYLTSTEAPFKIYALHTNPQVSLKLRITYQCSNFTLFTFFQNAESFVKVSQFTHCTILCFAHFMIYKCMICWTIDKKIHLN